MHLALARRYRPQNFLEVVGQDAVVRTLKNAIELNRLHHAYLFCGVRGVGKTSLARILAKSLNCEHGPSVTPCDTCSNCASIAAGNNLDVIEIDGASNNLVDDVRALREQVKFVPQASPYKIIIIDEVHMLSNSAFNALLKTLEEPPPHVKFIFATTEPHKLPVTIVSRCQKYDFRKVPVNIIKQHLKNIAGQEKIAIDEMSTHIIAMCAQGSVRDGVSLLEQIHTLAQQNITEQNVLDSLGLADRALKHELFAAIIGENLPVALKILNQIDERGVDLKLLAEDIFTLFRDLILYTSTEQLPPDVTMTDPEFIKTLKGKTDLSTLLAQSQMWTNTLKELAGSPYQKTLLEISLVKLNAARNMIGLAGLIERLQGPPSSSSPLPLRERVAEGRERGSEGPRKEGSSDWYKLVKWLTEQRPQLGSLLKEARPVSFSDKLIEVSFNTSSPTKDMVIERRGSIEGLLNTHFGHAVEFKVIEGDEGKKKP